MANLFFVLNIRVDLLTICMLHMSSVGFFTFLYWAACFEISGCNKWVVVIVWVHFQCFRQVSSIKEFSILSSHMNSAICLVRMLLSILAMNLHFILFRYRFFFSIFDASNKFVVWHLLGMRNSFFFRDA